MFKIVKMEKFKNWMTESANILFDDSKNDLRSLPKSVRLQILLVLSLFGQRFLVYMFFLTLLSHLVGLELILHTLD